MNSIELKNVTKKLKGNTVLDDITFTFESGNIYGLYGRNASGKTMLLRAIAGLIYPNSGEVRIEGKILHKDISFPESMGIIIERTELLPQYTGMENLKILAKIKKVASVEDMRESLVRVKLDPDDKRKVHAYSLGMKQKLSIAQAIFEKPRIILLDEPTNALDEEGVRSVRELFLEEKERGATIIVASHNKEDLAILADRIISISDGRITGSDCDFSRILRAELKTETVDPTH